MTLSSVLCNPHVFIACSIVPYHLPLHLGLLPYCSSIIYPKTQEKMRLSAFKSLHQRSGINKTQHPVASSQNINHVPKDEACVEVTKILGEKPSSLHVIRCSKFEAARSLFRSSAYTSYKITFHANYLTSAGWLLCKYALNGCCSIAKALHKFDQSLGTATLTKHSASYDIKTTVHSRMSFVLEDEKRQLWLRLQLWQHHWATFRSRSSTTGLE